MKLKNYLLILPLVLSLLACGGPVPADRATYVGEWKGKGMFLSITQDGKLDYRRKDVGFSKSIKAPMYFSGNNIEVEVLIMRSTFVVNKPPYQEGGKWKMVVDDVELTKSTKQNSKPTASH